MNTELIFSLLAELNHLCSQDEIIAQPIHDAIKAVVLSREAPLIVIKRVYTPAVLRRTVIDTSVDISSE